MKVKPKQDTQKHLAHVNLTFTWWWCTKLT